VLLSRRLVIGGESAGGFTALCALAAERLFFAVGASRYRQPLLALRHVAGET
jgi:dipeptidyl aminopeptidase/acylaminoacyl peptidase